MKFASRRRAATLVAALVTGGSALALTASPAQAAQDSPFTGALCTAVENIQFTDAAGNPSYTVQALDFIRIDEYNANDGIFAVGHGSGHSPRIFQWIHTTSPFPSRIANCH